MRSRVPALLLLVALVVACGGGDLGDIYQSAGYSCGPEPTEGCGGEPLSLTLVWLGHEGAHDFIDFFLVAPPGGIDLLGPADELSYSADAVGHGIRIVPLHALPKGIDVGGKFWLEVTVSATTAAEFSGRTVAEPAGQGAFSLHDGPSTRDPVRVLPIPESTLMIEELLLTNTTRDMMQWIVGLNEPGPLPTPRRIGATGAANSSPSRR